jgi:beta-mannosidase
MRLHPAGAAPDALAGAAWECWSCRPDAVTGPGGLDSAGGTWVAATVPGTAAAELRAQGTWAWGDDDVAALDGRDWWYRCSFDAPGDGGGEWELEFGGLATVADAWMNGRHLLHSENMWRSHRIGVGPLAGRNLLVLRFAALAPRLAARRPRPRWRSLMLRSQNQRWVRTSLLGRIVGWASSGAPVGPWRPVRLHRVDSGVSVRDRRLRTSVVGDRGVVEVRMTLDGVAAGTGVEVRVGEVAVGATAVVDADGAAVVEAVVELAGVERWWPRTHGAQPLYPVRLVVGPTVVDVASVGFRTVRVDRSDGAFTVIVNEVPVFCRGAGWTPPDVVSLQATEGAVQASLASFVEAGMNMVRVPGYSVYQDAPFWDACDQLGLLVWQDCMIAGFDPPEDPDFVEDLSTEWSEQLGALGGRPSLAVLCGSVDSQQQPAMMGLPPDRWRSPVLEELLPGLAAQVLPDVPYVPSAPTGGDLPFDPAVGVATYFGVGGYLRPLADVRSAGVRFAAECLAFATPPEPSAVERAFGSSHVAGHDPAWKAAVPRDSGTSWDHEEIRDRYVRMVFGVDPFEVRYADPDRALDYARAVVAELASTVFTEWRCNRSPCAGGLVLQWQDPGAGPGWGLRDVAGAPKAPWFALKRVLAPVAVLLTDDGLSGLGVHVVNDRPSAVRGDLRVTLFDMAGTPIEESLTAVEVAARSEGVWTTAALLGGFRDLTAAYRFGPPAYDVVRVDLDVDGVTAEAVHLPGGAGRAVEADLGLEAVAVERKDTWEVTVRTRRFAQWVSLDLPGFSPSDSWFHLAPRHQRLVALRPTGDEEVPHGRVRALNGRHSVPVVVAT